MQLLSKHLQDIYARWWIAFQNLDDRGGGRWWIAFQNLKVVVGVRWWEVVRDGGQGVLVVVVEMVVKVKIAYMSGGGQSKNSLYARWWWCLGRFWKLLFW